MSSSVMTPPEPGPNLTEIIAAASAAAAAVALVLQQIVKRFSDTRKDTTQSGAQIDVINSLRDELVRMAEQNTKLAVCLNSLQMEVINLRGENLELHTTVRHLHAEVKRLRQAGARSDFGLLEESRPG
jgi:predicted nuclease with TOPRIM domain